MTIAKATSKKNGLIQRFLANVMLKIILEDNAFGIMVQSGYFDEGDHLM